MPSARPTVNLQEIFNLTDKHGKGSVEVVKIGDLLRYAGLNPTEKTCAKIIEKLDTKMINLNDFISVYGEHQDSSLEFNSIAGASESKPSNSLNAMINAVRTFDHQGTGFISLNELKFILTGLGDKLKDGEFDDLRQFMEISPNGQVCYERKNFFCNVVSHCILEFITSLNES